MYKKNLMRLFLTLLCSACFLISCTNDSNEGRPPRIQCGGGIQFTCPINFYCDLGYRCGGIDKEGTCAPIPQSCDITEQTICGCDGKEYQNECIAKTLGVTKKNDGPCIEAPKFSN